jgi:hypothetical protein
LNNNYNEVWDVYFNCPEQMHDSAKTARNQIPRVAKYIRYLNLEKNSKVFDIGCGKHNALFKGFVEDLGLDYYGVDPFNKSKEENNYAIQVCGNKSANVVCINNVLNVIKEQEIWISILKQANNAISENGLLLIQVYEGTKTKSEKEMGIKTLEPIETRDGWQNRMKIEEYLDVVTKIFPNAKIINTKFGKFISSS